MNGILNYINPFHKPNAAQLRAELQEEYERLLIQSENTAAYHAKMAEFYREGIKRLRASK